MSTAKIIIIYLEKHHFACGKYRASFANFKKKTEFWAFYSVGWFA